MQVLPRAQSDCVQRFLDPMTYYKVLSLFLLIIFSHYSTPLIPDITGMESFEGQIIHSHNYRRPEAFGGKRVACLGAAASGQDIALDMAQHAEKVIADSAVFYSHTCSLYSQRGNSHIPWKIFTI